MTIDIKKELSSKSIFILGFAKEGISTFNFLRKLFPGKIIGIGDLASRKKLNIPIAVAKDKNIRWYLGKNYLKAIKNYDLIIKTPGIPITSQDLKKAFKDGKITSQTDLFLKYCPSMVIGVTGTKGKGTTCSLIYQILKEGKRRVFLVGNIGNPSLPFLEKANAKDIFVYEMSSHQLAEMQNSPQIAVFINVFPAHLDYYRDFQQYFRAKQNIFLYQKRRDTLIYNLDSASLKSVTKKSKAQKISFSVKNTTAKCYLSKGHIFYKGKRIFNTDHMHLLGDYNLANLMPALIIAREFGISEKIINRAVDSFRGLPYRLEFIGKHKSIDFYNDSLATVPEAAIAGIQALSQKVKTIMLGGYDSGLDFNSLAKNIAKSNIENLILFPPMGDRIARLVEKYSALTKNRKDKKRKYFHVNNMKDAVILSYKHTPKGAVCLLSPAAPSFGIFENYKERGDLFKKYVSEYGKRT